MAAALKAAVGSSNDHDRDRDTIDAIEAHPNGTA